MRRSMKSGSWFRRRLTIRFSKAVRIGALIAASMMLGACVPTPETATPNLLSPMVTPLATVEVPPTATTETEATAGATEPSSSIWPLAADLYYLTDQGQVYRQPYQSPDLPPEPITSPDVMVSDFALAPGGDWLLVRVDGTI